MNTPGITGGTLLPNGKVLVNGGRIEGPETDTYLDAAELYDPATDSWSPTGSMTQTRYGHTTTLLQNGKVLVAGGCCIPNPRCDPEEEGCDINSWPAKGSAEIYDPATETWSPTATMARARYGHTATLLTDGRVLMTGGSGNGSNYVPAPEIYDPLTATWSSAASTIEPRFGNTATLLANGKVLVAGGSDPFDGNYNIYDSAELYDPITNSWTIADSMIQGRRSHIATRLANGKVLVTGGYPAEAPLVMSSAEIYDPVTDSWSSAGNMARGRTRHTATLLPNEKVLVAGGGDDDGGLDGSEFYDPATNSWSPAGTMTEVRMSHSASLLQNGKVLVAGGHGHNASIPLSSAELFDPAWTSPPVLPTSTPGHALGRGQIPSASTNQVVAFDFTAKSKTGAEVTGACNLVDGNSRVKCLDATTLVQEGTHATFFGNATVNGAPTTYRIDVDDLAEPGRGRDIFKIQTDSGYTASGTLTQGNIQIHK